MYTQTGKCRLLHLLRRTLQALLPYRALAAAVANSLVLALDCTTGLPLLVRLKLKLRDSTPPGHVCTSSAHFCHIGTHLFHPAQLCHQCPPSTPVYTPADQCLQCHSKTSPLHCPSAKFYIPGTPLSPNLLPADCCTHQHCPSASSAPQHTTMANASPRAPLCLQCPLSHVILQCPL